MQKSKKLPIEKAVQRTVELLQALNIPHPAQLMERYPHQLSGGMNQRILAAIGMAAEPGLLIADEPTRGLDALIRGQVVNLFEDIKEKAGASILFITHDLKVARRLCDEVAVMYRGEIVELAPAGSLFSHPRHPYTRALLNALPENGLKAVDAGEDMQRPYDLDKGCSYYMNCPQADPGCGREFPYMREIKAGHRVRCMNVVEDAKTAKSVSCVSG